MRTTLQYMEIFKRKITNAQHGFCVRRAEVQNSTAVFQLNFSDDISLCAPKPARTQSPVPPHVGNARTTTQNKFS